MQKPVIFTDRRVIYVLCLGLGGPDGWRLEGSASPSFQSQCQQASCDAKLVILNCECTSAIVQAVRQCPQLAMNSLQHSALVGPSLARCH
jgi:hypothetical protein